MVLYDVLCHGYILSRPLTTPERSSRGINRFKSSESEKKTLTTKIEKLLSEIFNYKSRVVIVTDKELKKVINEAPPGFGKAPDEYRYDVIFIKEPLTATEALKSVRTKEGVDEAEAGTHALYFSRLVKKATQSHLSKIIQLPIYQNMTIRNWNTTTKLLALMSRE